MPSLIATLAFNNLKFFQKYSIIYKEDLKGVSYFTYEDIKAIWNHDKNERDNQMLKMKTWEGRDYEETVTDFVLDYLQDWIYECDFEDDLEYDDYNNEDWTEEY